MTTKNWKVLENSRYQEIFQEIANHAKVIGLLKNPIPEHLFVMKKEVKPWGYFRANKITKSSWAFQIAINERILNDENVVKKVLVHEIAHACCPCEGHSKKWKSIGNKIGKTYGITVHTTDDYADGNVERYQPREQYKYRIACTSCGRKWDYKRMSYAVKNPSDCYCTYCNKRSIVREF